MKMKPHLITAVSPRERILLMPQINLTPRQLQLLRAAAKFQDSNCYSPTIGDMAAQLGVSRSTAFEHIGELRKKGMLSAIKGRARSLALTSAAQELLENSKAQPDNYQADEGDVIPLAGRVAAGYPIEAVSQEEKFSFSSCFSNNHRDLFSLEVAGDSMVDDGIFNGDYVICKKQSAAANGQIVVARVNEDEATLKRFYKEKSRVRLQPANDSFEPIYSNNCCIEAVVVGVVRKL